MGLLGFKLESGLVSSLELKVSPGLAVFTGLNATFKSLTARTLAGCGDSRPFRPTLHDVGVSVEYLPEHEACNIGEKYLIEDNRLVLRKLLGFLKDSYHDVKRIINDLKDSRDERIKDLSIELEKSIDRIYRSVGLDFVDDLMKIKSRAVMRVVSELYTLMDRVLDRIREELGEDAEKVVVTPLIPYVKELWEVQVYDLRFNTMIPTKTSSSSIIAPMLFEYVTAFLSIPEKRLLVIEEPEESMSPLQQVVFAKYLELAVRQINSMWAEREAYVIITTHSPYISMSFTEEVPVYYFGFKNRKIVIEEKPMKNFVLGDSVLGVRIGK